MFSTRPGCAYDIMHLFSLSGFMKKAPRQKVGQHKKKTFKNCSYQNNTSTNPTINHSTVESGILKLRIKRIMCYNAFLFEIPVICHARIKTFLSGTISQLLIHNSFVF